VALDVDSLLQVFTTSGPDIWMRQQHAPGHGPWESWESLGLQGRTGEPALAVAAQATLASGGRERLRLFLSVPGTVAFYIISQVSGGGR